MKPISTLLRCLLSLLFIIVKSSASITNINKYGGDINNSKSSNPVINVHIIPHTHDDVGWLKTIDQYTTGMNNTIYKASTNNILDSVIQELSEDKKHNDDRLKRTFVYSEQAFFQRWWRKQSTTTQQLVLKLHENGQFEFVNGGWCMHDEASAHYVGMIDQTTLGHAFLKSQFNAVPTTGWQLDPFGHSSFQSIVSSMMGFDSLFFGRADFRELIRRKNTSATEMIWKPSSNTNTNTIKIDNNAPQPDLFTVLFDFYSQEGTYGPPNGLCFDPTCNDPLMQDDKTLKDYNVDQQVELFVEHVMYRKSFIIGNEIMFLFGNDFNYEFAKQYFDNLDTLIQAVNDDGRVSVSYSTPAKYVRAKYDEHMEKKHESESFQAESVDEVNHYDDNSLSSSNSFPLKTDDFFPYADQLYSYWSGFFTSRPTLKFYIIYASAYLQVSRQLQVLNIVLDKDDIDNTNYSNKSNDEEYSNDGFTPFIAPNEPLSTAALVEAVSIAQHHDAITGTSKQHVASDWSERIAAGMNTADTNNIEIMSRAFSEKLRLRLGSNTELAEMTMIDWQVCHQLNCSQCDILAQEDRYRSVYNGDDKKDETSIFVSVYNPLASHINQSSMKSSTTLIKLPLPGVNSDANNNSNPLLPRSISTSNYTYSVTDLMNGNVVKSILISLPITSTTERDTNAEFQKQLHFYPDVPPLSFSYYEIKRIPVPSSLDMNSDETNKSVQNNARIRNASAVRNMASMNRFRNKSRKILSKTVDIKYDHEMHSMTVSKNRKKNFASSTIDIGEKAGDGDMIILENEFFQVQICGMTGAIVSLTDKESGVSTPFSQNFEYYRSYTSPQAKRNLINIENKSASCPSSLDDNDPEITQNSGAYVFRPDGEAEALGQSSSPRKNRSHRQTISSSSTPIAFEILRDESNGLGEIVGVVQQWSDYIWQTVSLGSLSKHVDMEFRIGPIPVDDNIGKEVVTVYRTDLESDSKLYTDSNGRNMIARYRNYRQSYDVDMCRDQPISCNYYPVTTAAYIKDDTNNKQFTVLTDRSQGAASLNDGELEIMLHRRLLVDDNRGVDEPLNETDGGMSPYPDWKRMGEGIVIIGSHKLMLSTPNAAARSWRPAMQSVFSSPQLFFGRSSRGRDSRTVLPSSPKVKTGMQHESLVLTQSFPDQLEIMTLQPISEWKILLRLQHKFDENEDEVLSQCVKVNILETFGRLKVRSVKEMSLTNNQEKKNMKYLKWSTEDDRNIRRFDDYSAQSIIDENDAGTYTICALEIRTFVLELY